MSEDELLQGLIVDLRRGTLVLAVLSSINQPKYGYELLQDMEKQGIRIEANTLYPLLRRLESQGLLQSQWDTAESRPRKYYTLIDRGRVLHAQLRDEWRRMTCEMENLLGKD
ncbi:PadR family transcriptional regulator [Candidatus Arthromitus sp. SFB-rat-Yit]|uniref:PadR family transcriptional regulator n=1 Tax=Candidatus Arthromitus sp. SFB-rat-Yit TaxID=1041504 RepID=UPI000227A7D3|nr:PadR family transcriptional regulator [Candidatus Arthromitus sp. SFB-rat-Yit]BAK80704.1 transcriptional regulator, PadR-like family [Candidatus Arthromitus sp. SFB-rat-Yit]